MEAFASNLRKRADELGISNAEVERRAGLSERRYGNYISGRREPDLATLVRIATVLGVSPNELLSFGTGPAKRSQAASARDRIETAAQALDLDDLNRVAIMIEALAEKRSSKVR
jgi:transcriptional regulator with XRE-family HTH domain